MSVIDGIVIEYDDGTVESFGFKDNQAADDIDSMRISEEKSEESVVACPCEDNADYSYINVADLTMEAGGGNCHGFITFGDSSPVVTVSGFHASSGDDITEAGPGETWEFSAYSHNEKSYIIWKNWSA